MTRFLAAFLCALAILQGTLAAEQRSPKGGSNSPPALDAAAAHRAGIDPQTLPAARKLYTTKCMRCHKSYDPAPYSQPQWEAWMTKMRKKARLSPEQDALLSHYLDAYRSISSLTRTNSGY